MADNPDRITCGRTGTMFYKLTADGKRDFQSQSNKPPKRRRRKRKRKQTSKQPSTPRRTKAKPRAIMVPPMMKGQGWGQQRGKKRAVAEIRWRR